MDSYKFGNALCALREGKNMTQKELADILGVSDKAVSKWENGQAMPRINVLEKIAEVFETSVEALISSGKENVKRIYIQNSYGSAIHIETRDGITSLLFDEGKWIEIDKSANEYELKIYGEIDIYKIEDDFEQKEDIEAPQTLKDKLLHKGFKKGLKWISKYIEGNFIQTKCTYNLSEITDNSNIEIEFETFSMGDRMWIGNDVRIVYPKLNCEGCRQTLTNAVCINKPQVLKSFRRSALTSELGISIPLMLIAYPFRKAYIKHILKPASLLKQINKAPIYLEKEAKSDARWGKIKHPVLAVIGAIILFLILFIESSVFFDIIGVESDKPVLVYADLSKVEFFNEEYVRIDELPKGTVADKALGVEVWYDARLEGLSKTDQYLEDDKATPYVDAHGNKYLWLVFDYADTMLLEDGHAEYDDFDEHYVYMCKAE